MVPCVTLYHWDLPAHLQTPELPGWMSPKLIEHFTNFANLCFERFAHRVPMWVTFNEPAVFVFGGYQGGWNAPGICQTTAQVWGPGRGVNIGAVCMAAEAQQHPVIGSLSGSVSHGVHTVEV